MNLTEATIKALQGKLYEEKYLVSRQDWGINNDHEADWFGRDACWADIRELNLKPMSDEEKVKALQSLKDNIDTDVMQRADYNNIDSKYVSVWLAGYKSTIDRFISELDTKGKYYIFMSVDISDRGDVDHRGSDLIIDSGNIIKGTKYYNTKEEAQKAMSSISKAQYEKFMYDNFIGEYDDDIIQWNVSVEKYKPNTWEIQ